MLSEPLLYVHDLGLIGYDQAWSFQRAAASARIAGKHPPAGSEPRLEHDLLILCEHPAVVTLGRSTKPGNLLATPDYLESKGIQLREVERGGDVTIHEPGQLVAYPIIDLDIHKRDLHWYLRQVEQAIIEALASFGLTAMRTQGLTGVWIDDRKIASIGVHARDWVTWHGVALNVTNDLQTFSHVVPCGIGDVTMTNVERECRQADIPVPDAAAVREAVVMAFANVFNERAVALPADAVDQLLTAA
jgi:lipoyl(octanoyl) transferase